MALSLSCQTTRAIELGDYVSYLRRKVDFADVESVLDSASKLRELANQRTLVLDSMNEAVRANFRGDYLKSAQTLVLARSDQFLVRAAIWPPASSVAAGRIYQEQFSYDIAHDHNFSFMTVNYLGPGYDTDIYEYDYGKVAGYEGEPVDLVFLEKVHFGSGCVMYYRANKDVHIQRPPTELTISLNLVWWPERVRFNDQLTFNVDEKKVAGHVGGGADRRVSLLRMAALLGNDETRGHLEQLSSTHPCRRTRLAAFEAMATLSPGEASNIWKRATADPAPLLQRAARLQLERPSV